MLRGSSWQELSAREQKWSPVLYDLLAIVEMKSPTVCTLLTFLAFAIQEIEAQDRTEQLGKLPVCAVSDEL
jgi:hypothetical protein